MTQPIGDIDDVGDKASASSTLKCFVTDSEQELPDCFQGKALGKAKGLLSNLEQLDVQAELEDGNKELEKLDREVALELHSQEQTFTGEPSDVDEVPADSVFSECSKVVENLDVEVSSIISKQSSWEHVALRVKPDNEDDPEESDIKRYFGAGEDINAGVNDNDELDDDAGDGVLEGLDVLSDEDPEASATTEDWRIPATTIEDDALRPALTPPDMEGQEGEWGDEQLDAVLARLNAHYGVPQEVAALAAEEGAASSEDIGDNPQG
jgi:hypothetical protein